MKEYQYDNKSFNAARRYEAYAQLQTIAAFLATEFVEALKKCNETISKDIRMEYLDIQAIHFVDNGHRRNMTMEKHFTNDTKFIKFSNNTSYQLMSLDAEKKGVSMDLVDLVMAFSHWTHTVNRFKT